MSEISAESESAPLRVLFLCTHNSARSQIAEALLRHLQGGWERDIAAFSAGVVARGVHPGTRPALERAGVSTEGLESKTIDELTAALGGEEAAGFDVVVTVCDNAREACPYLPARRRNLHRSFDDPSAAPEEDRPAAFDRAVAEIRSWLETAVPDWLHGAG